MKVHEISVTLWNSDEAVIRDPQNPRSGSSSPVEDWITQLRVDGVVHPVQPCDRARGLSRCAGSRIPIAVCRGKNDTADVGGITGVDRCSTERVQAVLDRVRPFLQADGGDIVLMNVGGNKATVQLTGKCAAVRARTSRFAPASRWRSGKKFPSSKS